MNSQSSVLDILLLLLLEVWLEFGFIKIPDLEWQEWERDIILFTKEVLTKFTVNPF